MFESPILVCDGKLRLTSNHIDRIAPGGGMRPEVAELLGLTWPLDRGWRKQLRSFFVAWSLWDRILALATAPVGAIRDTIVLTSAHLHAAATGGCGWTKKQLAVLGVPWPPPQGWLDDLIGTTVPRATYEAFCRKEG